jgi:hypothetical protein
MNIVVADRPIQSDEKVSKVPAGPIFEHTLHVFYIQCILVIVGAVTL